MENHRVVQFSLALAAVLFVIVVSALGSMPAQAAALSSSKVSAVEAPAQVKAPAFPNAAPGDAILGVTGTAFKPRASDITFASTDDGGGIYCTGAGTSYVIFNTPVDLPQGSVVKSLRMYFYDSDPTYFCAGFFTVYDLNGSLVQEWYAASPAASVGAGYADSPAINHTIDYTKYTYLLNWLPSTAYSGYNSNLQLRAIQLNYTPAPAASSKVVVVPLN